MILFSVFRFVNPKNLFSGLSKGEKLSNLIAFISLTISTITFIYAYKGIEYSLKPVLEIGICDSQTNTEYYGLILQNKGMGTATIEVDSIFFDNKLIVQSGAQKWQDSILRLGFGKKSLAFAIAPSTIKMGSSVSANQEVLMLTTVKSDIENIEEFNNVLQKISIKLKYKSVTGKKYILSYGNDQK
jgi:hypothetical protein